MSKISLFDVAPPQIPQVDNTLEEDSFHSPEQFQITTTNKQVKSSHPAQTQHITNSKDDIQADLKMSTSLVMKSDQVDSSPLINAQITDQSQQSMLNSILQSKVEQEIKCYLDVCSKRVQTVYSQFKMRLATQITYKIKKQIQKGLINISEKTANLEFKSKENQLNPNDISKQLERKKQQAIQKIKEIEAERINLIGIMKKKNIVKKQIMRDILTEEQKKRLAELIKQKRQFQKSVNRKNQQLVEEAKMKKLRDEKQRQKLYFEENEKKKIKILQSLKFLQLKSKQRQQNLKNSVLRENRIYTHKRYQKQWKEQQKLSENQQRAVLQSIHKKYKFSISQINQHDKKYSLDMKRRQQQNRLKQSRISQSLPKRQKTYFDQIVESQINSIKQKNQQEKRKQKQNQFKRKITDYQLIINQKFKPKLDTSKSFVLPIQRAYSSVSLTKEQRVQIGLEYLAKAKELKKSQQKRQKMVQNKMLTGYSAYKDYLKEREPIKYNVSKRQFSQIVRKPKQSYQELQIAKNMAQGLEAKFKKNADNKMYQSMKNKLLLLDSLY